jgi:hypothetical protein
MKIRMMTNVNSFLYAKKPSDCHSKIGCCLTTGEHDVRPFEKNFFYDPGGVEEEGAKPKRSQNVNLNSEVIQITYQFT